MNCDWGSRGGRIILETQYSFLLRITGYQKQTGNFLWLPIICELCFQLAIKSPLKTIEGRGTFFYTIQRDLNNTHGRIHLFNPSYRLNIYHHIIRQIALLILHKFSVIFFSFVQSYCNHSVCQKCIIAH